MRTVLVFLLVAISISLPVRLFGGETRRSAARTGMPPAVVAQITNAGNFVAELRVDGQFVGTVAPREMMTITVFPGYRYLEWKWLPGGERATARVEVPNEPSWQYTIR